VRKVTLAGTPFKYLKRLDRATQERVQKKLLEVAADPFDARSSKPLVSKDKRSSRVGDYRILFLVTDTEV
jgi:mRNA-degrading endonuclease RelE of RelBE toxin-antitoxin system